jgi:hypothetical protein
LDVHEKTISYCVKDVSGRIQQEGKVGSTRRELAYWMKTLPRPWTVAMKATTFSGWIYDHLLPHATQIKVDTLAERGDILRGLASGSSIRENSQKVAAGCVDGEPGGGAPRRASTLSSQ